MNGREDEATRQMAELLSLLAGSDIEAARSEAAAIADGQTRAEIESRALRELAAADLARGPEPLLPAGERAAAVARAWAWAEIVDQMDETGQPTYHAPGYDGHQDRHRGTAPEAPGPAWSGHVISNFSHGIDAGLEEDLRAGKLAEHVAWNFAGIISYDSSSAGFAEEVSVHHVVQGTRRAATLPELMRSVNDEFGWR